MEDEGLLIGMALDHVCSVTFTILVFPDYRAKYIDNETSRAETIIVPEVFIDGFLQDLQSINGLEEGLEEEDFDTLRTFSRYFEYDTHDGYPLCYKVINAFYVDQSMKFHAVAHGSFDNQIKARNLFGKTN